MLREAAANGDPKVAKNAKICQKEDGLRNLGQISQNTPFLKLLAENVK